MGNRANVLLAPGSIASKSAVLFRNHHFRVFLIFREITVRNCISFRKFRLFQSSRFAMQTLD